MESGKPMVNHVENRKEASELVRLDGKFLEVARRRAKQHKRHLNREIEAGYQVGMEYEAFLKAAAHNELRRRRNAKTT